MTPNAQIASAVPFLGDISVTAAHKFLAGATQSEYAPHADILRPGDEVGGVYFVSSGTIRVYYVGPDGREGTLYWIERGESCILALNCLFTELKYPAWACASDAGANVISISGAAFRDLFSNEACVQRFVFDQLSERVFSLLTLLEQAMRLPLEERLVLLLLSHADEAGVVSMTQETIASHLGTIREVVSRLLRNLASQGLISSAPKRITLIDRPRLERLCSGERNE